MLETSNLLWARKYRLIKEIYRNQVNSFIESLRASPMHSSTCSLKHLFGLVIGPQIRLLDAELKMSKMLLWYCC